MHREVKIYFENIKQKYPKYFNGISVLDCGCLDINGNNRFLFSNSSYLGIDIVKGRNVDVVTKVHEFKTNAKFDVVMSSEMLEHDCNYVKSLKKMFDLTKSNGLLLITAAGTNRPEHGTHLQKPKDSPLTNDYYQNVTVDMLQKGLDFTKFSWFEISYIGDDIRFAGIKRGG